MNRSRRRMVMGGLGLLVPAAVIGAKASAQVPNGNSAVVPKRSSEEEATKERNQSLSRRAFRIRINNKYTWDIIFGTFGMRGHEIGFDDEMKWRQIVRAGHTFSSGMDRIINGGWRVLVVWDKDVEEIKDFQKVLVDRHLTIEVDSSGAMSIT